MARTRTRTRLVLGSLILLARVDQLVPYERNARTHSPASLDKLCRLITENGWTKPILVAGVDILAGHARWHAARKLAMDQVPVIDLSHLSKAQRRAYILSDNRSALDAGWDDDLLREEMGELRDGGFDLTLSAFDPHELDALFGEFQPTGSDPEPRAAKTETCPECHHKFAQ